MQGVDSGRISELASEALREVWADGQTYPAWARRLAEQSTVDRILRLAGDVLVGLNLSLEQLSDTAPEEYAYHWRKAYGDNRCVAAPGAEPDADVVGTLVAKSIATGIYTMTRHSRRYRAFLDKGAPAGMPAFPEYAGDGGVKTEYISWDRFAHSGHRKRSVVLCHQSEISAAQPLRRQSLRSRTHDISDHEHPGHFA